jgi:acetyl esterase/lipase
MTKPFVNVFSALLSAFSLSGCQAVSERVIVKILYREAKLPSNQIHRDLTYWEEAGADPRKHKLDLYVPGDINWPVLLFVHGGSWSSGDKGLKFGNADPYANIGRFYASRGIGVAVINYRLQPAVTWREQVDDVSRALAWVRQNAERYGGDPNALFVFGHSSGAQLAARAVLDEERLRNVGLSQAAVCGVISVSGTPFDLMDEQTYELGMDPTFLERHFRNGQDGDAWKAEASSVHLVEPSAPPFLLVHGRWEWKSLRRQNEVMYQSLIAAGVPSKLVITPWDEHIIIVAALSHPSRAASAAVLDFIRGLNCHDGVKS